MTAFARLFCLTLCLLFSTAAVAAGANWSRLIEPWPDPASLGDIPGVAVSWPSSSPFTPEDIRRGGEDNPATLAQGRLYLPPGPHAPGSVPAVVLLHGSGGVLPARELTYGPQLARMGVAALVVDTFGARRERGTAYIERILNISETMILADAYSSLGFLAQRPEIDRRHIVLTGFSYGAMAAMYGLYAQIAEAFAAEFGLGPLRFAGHVAFYGPCIARAENSRTTGAPLLMLYGDKDELIRPDRCAEIAADFRAGGSRVETITYPGAVHQWDGNFGARPIGKNLSGCSLSLERDGTVRDRNSGIAMTGSLSREVILGLCTLGADPYPIARNDQVRARSNLDFGRFLAAVFSLP